MSKDKLIPELRFPEFEKDGEWKKEPLGNLSEEIVEKTKGRKYKLMSITSGVGLVSQIEKFGREIAGNSYKNYYVIRNHDFAYNKSSTKLYSEGEIAMFEDEKTGAVPNSIFTCFRFDENIIFPPFAKYPFVNNLHGNWLRKFIAVGARANGALQVKSKDLFSVPFPYPTPQEQQKIASCLSSLDKLLAAHNEKLDALKDHKKGLMQNLFPQEGETVPKVRFKEFEKNGEWIVINNSVKIISGNAYKMSLYSNKGIRLAQGANIFNGRYSEENTIFINPLDVSAERNVKIKNGDILLALNRPITNNELKVCLFPFDEGFLYQRAGKLEYKGNLDKNFLYQFLCTPLFLKRLKTQLVGSDQPYIKSTLFDKDIIIAPSKPEQQKIASCLSEIDELITAQTEKIKQLQQHKKGLMQGLFPKFES
ncbi:restriction endonuclease subunit S [Maribacter sp. 6B07]|uniref:restriction endonuclease subunit S n=1 Tax=Maribacter sp. 6B07 TaxID=2045442 RepID=UPI000C08D767|nr:restriction endonuclease subunit S [Maribacter sp. 6B07]PHN95007.1 restriction endonuclease subunit S [Maribacter sp. 6B07]